MGHGKAFHNFDTEYVKDMSQSAVLDLGTAMSRFQKILVDVCRFLKLV